MELERGYAVVKIYTSELAIVGKVLVTEKDFRKGRLSDYLNRKDLTFLPVQDAHVFSLETKKRVSSKTFILLNKEKIDWVLPVREPGEDEKRQGGHEDLILG